jgi:hypothetical protein
MIYTGSSMFQQWKSENAAFTFYAVSYSDKIRFH